MVPRNEGGAFEARELVRDADESLQTYRACRAAQSQA